MIETSEIDERKMPGSGRPVYSPQGRLVVQGDVVALTTAGLGAA